MPWKLKLLYILAGLGVGAWVLIGLYAWLQLTVGHN